MAATLPIASASGTAGLFGPYRRRDQFPQKAEWLDNGCLVWTGHCCNRGYGKSMGRPTHRIAYERAKGPIPPGMFVCHACDNRRCINPEHLWLGTNADNMRDMKAKGRGRGQSKTHCPLGHEYTPENTRRSPRRHCRTCERAYQRRVKAARECSP